MTAYILAAAHLLQVPVAVDLRSHLADMMGQGLSAGSVHTGQIVWDLESRQGEEQ